MNLVTSIEQYNNKNIFFCEPIKNNIMNNGNFVRILYSTPNVLFNGVYLLLKFYDVTCEKYYNKYKSNFIISNNKELIEHIKIIEEEILKKYKINKIPCHKIYEQLKMGYIKFFTETTNNTECSFILKISGIWETQQNYGLTYKFIKIN
jgi:hypothetical protein